ncbi:hypothetical protein AVEN_181233-1, partial [Araneus ventricosus]
MCGPSLTPGNHYFQTQSATAVSDGLFSPLAGVGP